MSGEAEDYEYMYSKRICNTTMKLTARRKKEEPSVAWHSTVVLVVMERTTCMSGGRSRHAVLWWDRNSRSDHESDLHVRIVPSRPVSVRGGGALATLQFSVRRRFLARVRLNDDAVAARPSSHTFSVRR